MLKQFFSRMVVSIRNFLMAPLCNIRGCDNAATRTAHVRRISGSINAGSFIPVCHQESCLNRIEEVETIKPSITSLDTLLSMARHSGRRVGILRSL